MKEKDVDEGDVDEEEESEAWAQGFMETRPC